MLYIISEEKVYQVRIYFSLMNLFVSMLSHKYKKYAESNYHHYLF